MKFLADLMVALYEHLIFFFGFGYNSVMLCIQLTQPTMRHPIYTSRNATVALTAVFTLFSRTLSKFCAMNSLQLFTTMESYGNFDASMVFASVECSILFIITINRNISRRFHRILEKFIH